MGLDSLEGFRFECQIVGFQGQSFFLNPSKPSKPSKPAYDKNALRKNKKCPTFAYPSSAYFLISKFIS